MTVDPLGLAEDVEAATDRFLATARRFDDADVAEPSLLPGWTRGHVLTHVARNADGAVNLLTWARTGVETPQYLSAQQRTIDIEAGARRGAAEQLADLVAAHARLREAVAEMPPQAWTTVVRWTSGAQAPAARVMWSRLREVEIHHVDLGAGYGPTDWPSSFSVRMATSLAKDFGERAGGPRLVLRIPEVGHDLPVGAGVTGPVVVGSAPLVVAWLIGRANGDGLAIEPPGPLPPLPAFS